MKTPAPTSLPRILLVDDDQVVQAIVQASLQKRFEVISETSGASALARAEEVRPRLILLDLNMPNTDGFEVLQGMKNHPRLASIPVICVSGMQDATTRERAYRMGASGYLTKPLEPRSLAQDIEKLLTAMNKTVASEDGQREVFIAYNSAIGGERLKADLAKCLEKPANRALVITFRDADQFLSPEELEPLKSDRLVYLRMKPSLIARLPYLEEVSSVMSDLQDLLDAPMKDYTLFFDGPETALNLHDSEHSVATTLAFGSALKDGFSEIHYYCRVPGDPEAQRRLNDLANRLITDF